MELHERTPEVLDSLVTVALPRAKKCEEKNIPPPCEAYGILMNTRWQEFSLIQKINTILLGVGHATARSFLIIITVVQLVMPPIKNHGGPW